jgi:hypothetical protein
LITLPRLITSRWLKHVLQLLPPLIIGALFIVASTHVDRGNEDPQPTAVPVVVLQGPTPTPVIAPIRIVNLEVTPAVLTIGSQGTLSNGICNDSNRTINVQMYLGAQKVGVDPLLAQTVDLAGRDTPEGRLSRNIEPGCFGTEPFTNIVDERLGPGRWKLNLNVYVGGDPRPISRSSAVFEVRPAQ